MIWISFFGDLSHSETKPHLTIYKISYVPPQVHESMNICKKKPLSNPNFSQKSFKIIIRLLIIQADLQKRTQSSHHATCCCGIARSLLLHQNLRQFWGFVNTWLESHPVSAASNICSNSWNRQQSTNCCSYRMEAAKVYKELWLRRGGGDSTVRAPPHSPLLVPRLAAATRVALGAPPVRSIQ